MFNKKESNIEFDGFEVSYKNDKSTKDDVYNTLLDFFVKRKLFTDNDFDVASCSYSFQGDVIRLLKDVAVNELGFKVKNSEYKNPIEVKTLHFSESVEFDFQYEAATIFGIYVITEVDRGDFTEYSVVAPVSVKKGLRYVETVGVYYSLNESIDGAQYHFEKFINMIANR